MPSVPSGIAGQPARAKGKRVTRWKSVLVITAAVLAPLAASAEERLLTLRPEKTRVTFNLKVTAHEVNGVLALEAGQIRFDSATGAASGQITIDRRRAETGNSLGDREMHKTVRVSAEVTFGVPYVEWGLHNPSFLVLRVARRAS